MKLKQTKIEEIEQHLENQREIFKGQIEKLEHDLEEKQKQWIN